jgi:hypothetical protein
VSIDTPFQPFTDTEIDIATNLNGVYALYDGSEAIHYGKGGGAEGIKGHLKSHKAGYEGQCTTQATYFNYEICSNPPQREAALIREHITIWEKLPRCNDVVPMSI